MSLFELLLLCGELYNNSRAISDADGNDNWSSTSPVPLLLLLLLLEAFFGDNDLSPDADSAASGDVNGPSNPYHFHQHLIIKTLLMTMVAMPVQMTTLVILEFCIILRIKIIRKSKSKIRAIRDEEPKVWFNGSRSLFSQPTAMIFNRNN